MKHLLKRVVRIFAGLRTAWSILGLTLLLIVLIELALRAVFVVRDLGRPQIPPDPRVISASEGSASWLALHYRELERLSDRWTPYVYFRQRAFAGETIHVDSEGIRRTWQPPSREGESRTAEKPLKILLLGGSSLWGFGARDDRTIPSFLAKSLHEKGLRFEIRNLAEIGYVSTQELIALVRELQGGYRPDVVLCYDGVNDTTSALLEKQPAVTTNEGNRVREFNMLQSPTRLAAAMVRKLIQDSATFRFASSVGRRFIGAAGVPAALDLHDLAAGVVRGYVANVKMIESLGKAYGFQPVFVWQPDVFTKPRLVPFEAEEAKKHDWAHAFFDEVHRQVRQSERLGADPSFIDLSGHFEKTDSLAYLDFCHTSEDANQEIAETLMSRLTSSGVLGPASGAPR